MEPRNVPHRVHLVGIGGAGMAAIALYLLEAGHAVSGSDRRKSAETERLSAAGARIFLEHAAANVGDAAILVVSDAIGRSNPEIAEARLRDVPILRRAACLALLAQRKRAVFVAGSHGKSTTTAMIAKILDVAGLAPAFIAGAPAAALGSVRARFTPGELLVAEACEAFNNLAPLTPDIAVITNVDDDHLEHYHTQARLNQAFVDFVQRMKADGIAFVNGDDEGVRRIRPRLAGRVTTFGLAKDNDVRIAGLTSTATGSRFTIESRTFANVNVTLPIPGRHAASNALAAAAVCLHLGVSAEAIAQVLGEFSGVDRRWNDRGECGGVRVVEDYAHHPTALAAAIATARDIANGRRLIIAFQPQLFSRTCRLSARFADVLRAADRVLLVDVDPAGEPDDPDGRSDVIAAHLRRFGANVDVLGEVDQLAVRATELIHPGDFLLIAGAGAIGAAREAIEEKLRTRNLPALATPSGPVTQQGGRKTNWGSRGTAPTVADLFHQRAHEAPDAIAIASADATLTYRELDAESDRRAAELAARDVTPGTVVALNLRSSRSLVTYALALAKLDAVYCPLDRNLPPKRSAFMLDVANCALVVTEDGIDPHPRARHAAVGAGGAYVCFTSGSTGKPKGVAVSQRALTAFARDASTRFDLRPGARLALNTAIGFDVAIGELWMALTGGACLCVTDAERPLVGDRLAEFLERMRVTHLAATPSVLRSLPPHPPQYLRCIIAAGEVCTQDLVDRWAPGRRFFNAYGPTEATIYATVARCTAGHPVSIGKPMHHLQAHVLDENSQTATEGELVLAGIGLADGYLGSANDGANFLTHPKYGRVYRTGDLVGRDRLGTLWFAGRRDRQVKLLGNRIELDEIEATIRALPSVLDAAVCVADAKLIAFVTTAAETTNAEKIRADIEAWLPAHMLPQVVLRSDLALTPSGKRDYAAMLAGLGQTRVQHPFVTPPRTKLEARIAAVWSEVLKPGADVGMYDDFEALGGDSLQTLILIDALEAAFEVTIPPGYFETITNVANMAVQLDELLWKKRPGPVLALDGFRATRIYHQQRHLTAAWKGARVDEGGLICSFGSPEGEFDLFLCVQQDDETQALHRYLGPEFRVHGMRSGHLVMTYSEENVDQLTGHYLEELQRIAPRGRLLVGGICQGGTIAFAMARKLAALQRSPELLLLIEQGRFPAYDGSLAFFYSRDSHLNPTSRFEDGTAVFDRVYGERYTLDIIDGPHGHFHFEPYIHEFVAHVRTRLTMQPLVAVGVSTP